VIHACDAVIGKPGYGTVAEALVHGTRFLYLTRESFREQAPLVESLTRRGCARPMPREDFAAGRWRTHLDALFAQPPPPLPPSAAGAAAVADAVLARLRWAEEGRARSSTGDLPHLWGSSRRRPRAPHLGAWRQMAGSDSSRAVLEWEARE
jgi:hypothetical protein